MAGKAPGDLFTGAGKAGFGLDRAAIADAELVAGLGVGLVEGGNERGAQIARLGRLHGQQVGHVAAPILVFITVAEHADGMSPAQNACQIGSVAEIIRPAHGQVSLRQGRQRACAGRKGQAKQAGMKTLLLHARTFARIAPRLKGLNAALNIVTVDDAQRFHDAWTSSALEGAPEVHLAFGNIDAFYSPSVREFMTAILKSPDFDWFQSAAAGIENPALVAIGQKAKRYTTNHTQAEAMAEWALWQALDFFRDGPGHRANQTSGKWERIRVREMNGSRWLIVGYGSIGQAVGKRVTALGGVVTGMRRTPGPAEGAARIAPPDALMAELPGADVVLLCPPHTPETEGMANAAFFAAMNPDALFLNLGRGALVDEAALMAALDAGRPAFAALDVTQTEPLPAENPLWRHHKVVITPHDSSDTPGTIARGDETFLANLRHYLDNETLKHLVDRSAFVTG